MPSLSACCCCCSIISDYCAVVLIAHYIPLPLWVHLHYVYTYSLIVLLQIIIVVIQHAIVFMLCAKMSLIYHTCSTPSNVFVLSNTKWTFPSYSWDCAAAMKKYMSTSTIMLQLYASSITFVNADSDFYCLTLALLLPHMPCMIYMA